MLRRAGSHRLHGVADGGVADVTTVLDAGLDGIRKQADPTAAAAWCGAAQACREPDLARDEAYARRRAAEALLRDRSSRQQGAAELRRACDLGTDLEAPPLVADIKALSRSARVPLATPRQLPADEVPGVPRPTAREREILGHLVAGRTYAEIAEELVISERTVSVHVSNMLHKPGHQVALIWPVSPAGWMAR
jgi:DNA-binding NarL/FixJ family response regulator